MLHRRACVSYLLEGRPKSLLAVAGLGSSAWDLSAAGNVAENFCFIGAMGQAAPFAFGLALAQPTKRIVLFTGDGEILMSLGMLATIANLAPANLVIAVLDNEVYGETGGQATATAGQSDLVAIARGAGIQSTVSVTKDSDLAALRQIIHSGDALHFANIKIVAEKLPLVFPYSFDGVTAVNRFREAATA
ncbi:MAG: thiamine pyrophosphate-dependent acetolactate synthase large subunit-like protein [Gammaproteobacteria bacterium]|jgi:thiamine pyrophosphate-dependent acetolactate synthase large subunit-like protein